MAGSLEERIRRLEEELARVMERLEALEAALGAGDLEGVLREAARLVALYGQSLSRALSLARLLARLEAWAGELDELDMAILEAVAAGRGESLRMLEQAVRRARGRASRALIRERLRRLEAMGLVRLEYTGRRLRVAPAWLPD